MADSGETGESGSVKQLDFITVSRYFCDFTVECSDSMSRSCNSCFAVFGFGL